MRAGTGRLPGRDVFCPGFKNCLYGRRDGDVFYPGMISPGTICKVSIISSRQSETECLYDKNCLALAGIPVERTGIPLCRDGTKNVAAKFFPYKRNGTNKSMQYICMARSRVTSRPGKHPVPANVPSRQTSRPASHINSPLRSQHTVRNVFYKLVFSVMRRNYCKEKVILSYR